MQAEPVHVCARDLVRVNNKDDLVEVHGPSGEHGVDEEGLRRSAGKYSGTGRQGRVRTRPAHCTRQGGQQRITNLYFTLRNTAHWQAKVRFKEPGPIILSVGQGSLSFSFFYHIFYTLMPVAHFRLWYFIEGTCVVGCVIISKYKYVADLQSEIHSQSERSHFEGVASGDLALLKVCDRLSPRGLNWCSEQHPD
ncbi:hypothetical protein EDB86DRAFT_2049844 [Lactarius hatsudake]|nr:hypothetical protein EDB86DRAFT_2049844 [Lactarius hatsudake]